jgi:undecaprenyl diphosphate synthase
MTSQLLPKTRSIEKDRIVPQHLAIIMDGNGRWAKKRGLPRVAGHSQGGNNLKNILRYCQEIGIKYLTVYAFSCENWGRPQMEVEFLMGLFERLLKKELDEMDREGVKINLIGNIASLPSSLQKQIQIAVDRTKNNSKIDLNLAIDYGGRQEIVRACRHIAEKIRSQELLPEEINENTFKRYLYTHNLPDPDLLIRTSGEMRLSNFLLWQMAYTEIYVTDVLFPDFDRTELDRALLIYRGRDRRFGKLNDRTR